MDHLTVRGARMPVVGLGTWQLAGDECRRVVEESLAMGYRHLDTAQGYGNEAEVGDAIARSGIPRSELFVTTKVWPDHLVEHGLRCVEESLQRLRLQHVDLLLIHWPSPRLPLPLYLEPLRHAHEIGLARLVGVSNFPTALARQALALAPIACNQVEYHPYLAQPALLAQAEEEDLVLTAYCPIAHGRVHDDPLLRAIGARHGKTAAQVALRWLVQQPRVAAVPKAASARHLAENLDVFGFRLDEDEMARIAALARGERIIAPAFAPSWD